MEVTPLKWRCTSSWLNDDAIVALIVCRMPHERSSCISGLPWLLGNGVTMGSDSRPIEISHEGNTFSVRISTALACQVEAFTIGRPKEVRPIQGPPVQVIGIGHMSTTCDTIYSISHKICTLFYFVMVTFCFKSYIVPDFQDLCNPFTHIPQGCFNEWMSRCQWWNN